MAIVFFRIPKPKKFKYKPLFYDEAKDGQKLNADAAQKDFDRAIFKEELHQRWRKKDTGKRKSQGLAALLITILLVAVLVYLIFFKL